MTVNSHPKLKTYDIFHMPHLKEDNKTYLKKIIYSKFISRKTVKMGKYWPVNRRFRVRQKIFFFHLWTDYVKTSIRISFIPVLHVYKCNILVKKSKTNRTFVDFNMTVNSHPKLKTCDIFYTPHLKGDNKSYLKKIIYSKFICRKTVKMGKTDP